MTSSNPPSMAVTLARACRPLVIDFYTRRPPHTNTAGRSVPVSECRLLVFTTLTEGAVLGGGCDVNEDSAYAVSSQEGQRAGPAAEVTCGLPAIPAVAYTVVFILL